MKLYEKKEVEALIKRIIHQDSFGDVHYEAGLVSKETDLNFGWDEEDAERWNQLKQEEMKRLEIEDEELDDEDEEDEFNREIDDLFKEKYGYLNR